MAKEKALSVTKVKGIVQNAGNDMAKMNAVVGATIELLGSKFVVEVVKKAEGGFTLLLTPTKPDDIKECSLSELTDAVKKLMGEGTAVDTGELDQLISDSGLPADQVKICLSMAFLYINQGAPSEENPEGTRDVEYAFQIKASGLDKLLPEGLDKFIAIQDAQIAVWNTGRKKIVDAMGLIKPEEYLSE